MEKMKKMTLMFVGIMLTITLQAGEFDFTKENWKGINNDNGDEIQLSTTQYNGKMALHLKKHEMAILKKGEYSNFVLEYDVAGESMPGLGFRAKDLRNYEYMYFRVMNGGKKTAIQYYPVYNGAHGWMVYNYPHFESGAEIKTKEWFHVKMEVFGDKMRLFVNGQEQPNIETELLRTDIKKGSIFLKTSFANGYFANFTIKELKKDFSSSFNKPSEKYISTWKISEQIEVEMNAQFSFYKNYEKIKNEDKWKTIWADDYGNVNFAKEFEVPKGTVIAKTIIKSESEKEVELLFDYTHEAYIVLNGTTLFYGKEFDTDNFMRMMDGEEKLKLKLKKGENELVFMIGSDFSWQEEVGNPPYLGTKQAMNWGLIARLSNYEGIELMK